MAPLYFLKRIQKIVNRHKVLYLGLDSKNFETKGIVYHFPIIKIVPFDIQKKEIDATHVLFTSQTTVTLFFTNFKIKQPIFIAVGKATKASIEERGYKVDIVAKNETQEGIIEELEKRDLSGMKIFYPHSALARPLLIQYFKKKDIKFEELILYDTVVNEIEIPNPSEFDEIVFTSSSTVEAFVKRFGHIPTNKKLTCQGPITQKTLEKYMTLNYAPLKLNKG